MVDHPTGRSFRPGSSSTNVFRVKLRGAHRDRRGWYWKVGAKPVDIRIFGD